MILLSYMGEEPMNSSEHQSIICVNLLLSMESSISNELFKKTICSVSHLLWMFILCYFNQFLKIETFEIFTTKFSQLYPF